MPERGYRTGCLSVRAEGVGSAPSSLVAEGLAPNATYFVTVHELRGPVAELVSNETKGPVIQDVVQALALPAKM